MGPSPSVSHLQKCVLEQALPRGHPGFLTKELQLPPEPPDVPSIAGQEGTKLLPLCCLLDHLLGVIISTLEPCEIC